MIHHYQNQSCRSQSQRHLMSLQYLHTIHSSAVTVSMPVVPMGHLSLTTQTHLHRNLAVQSSRHVLQSAQCKYRHGAGTHSSHVLSRSSHVKALAHNKAWHMVNCETPWRSSPTYFARLATLSIHKHGPHMQSMTLHTQQYASACLNMKELSTPEEAVSPASGGMPVDCADWSLSPLFAGVPLVPAVKDSALLPMGEGALVLAGLTYLLSLGRALTTTNPARPEEA